MQRTRASGPVRLRRCSTDGQDLAAPRRTLRELGVGDERVYLDHRMTRRNRRRPGLEQAIAAVRAGDPLVFPKLDRLARSVPDARAIGDSLAASGVRLSIGGTLYDPTDPMGKMFFNILATFAEFEVDLLRMRVREGMAIARAKGRLRAAAGSTLGRLKAVGLLPENSFDRDGEWLDGGAGTGARSARRGPGLRRGGRRRGSESPSRCS